MTNSSQSHVHRHHHRRHRSLNPPIRPSSRRDLLETLAAHREFLRTTARGLTDAQARARQHGVGAEHRRPDQARRPHRVGMGRLHRLRPDGAGVQRRVRLRKARLRGFRMEQGETLASLLERYDEVARRTDDLVATLPDLDASHPLPEAPWFEPGAQLVGAARGAAHHRRDGPARRPRRHRPRGDRRIAHDGLNQPGRSALPVSERPESPAARSAGATLRPITLTVSDPLVRMAPWRHRRRSG